ncbi:MULTISPECIES: ATP-binding protein [Streptomyces]|uniref:ATP-binding protein n=1 Tax=Streptomyces TaxID=1883 RepID=UPI001D1316C0|nr:MULTISPECIES: ATP-binding protein [Streptomyces]
MASSSHAQPLERYDSSAQWSARTRFHLPAEDSSAAEARRRTQAQLREWRAPCDARDNAQLVISELVTNALRHTRSRSVGCELRINGSLLRVAVSGEGAGPRRGPSVATEEDEGGRGLLLVVTLSRGWGVRPLDAGRGHTVWADLPLHGAPA